MLVVPPEATGGLTVIVYCLVDVFVPSLAVTVNVEVVFELTALAVPEKVPFEFNVIPVGSEPEVTENVIVSPSSSVAVIVVRFELALPVSVSVPTEPEATPNTGEASTLKASSNVLERPETLVSLTSKGSLEFVL